MQVCAKLPRAGRDLRLDLFWSLANGAIFLDHIPHALVWCSRRHRRKPQLALGSDFRRRHGYNAHDSSGILLGLA